MGRTKYELKNWWQMATLPESKLSRPRNAEVYWSDTDSEENFKKNPKPGYTETSITYKYNAPGFRTKEFEVPTNKTNVLFLGCSHTEGIGLRIEDTWVHKVSEQLDQERFNCYNLGVAGGSCDTVVKNLVNCTNHLIPGVVFILWPPVERFDFYAQDGAEVFWDTMSAWNANKETMFLFEEAQSYNNLMRNKVIVDLLKEIHGFTFIELYADDLHAEFDKLPKTKDTARDNHWSPSFHTYVSNKFYSLYHYIMDQQWQEILRKNGQQS